MCFYLLVNLFAILMRGILIFFTKLNSAYVIATCRMNHKFDNVEIFVPFSHDTRFLDQHSSVTLVKSVQAILFEAQQSVSHLHLSLSHEQSAPLQPIQVQGQHELSVQLEHLHCEPHLQFTVGMRERERERKRIVTD